MGRLIPLYGGLSAANRKSAEADWAYRYLFGLCDDLAALAGGRETDETEDDDMSAFLAELDDGDDDLESQFDQRLSALERLLPKR
jgi:hypothetical protein